MPRYSISFTLKNIEQLNAIQAELGLASMSETVRACIHATHSKTFPSYIKANNQAGIAPHQRVSKTELKEQDKAKEKANKLTEAINICENRLDGVVATDQNNNPIRCAYYQYDGRRRHKQEIDIASVNEGLIETQYLPNRERVEKLQNDGNVDYDPKQTIEQELGIA